MMFRRELPLIEAAWRPAPRPLAGPSTIRGAGRCIECATYIDVSSAPRAGLSFKQAARRIFPMARHRRPQRARGWLA